MTYWATDRKKIETMGMVNVSDREVGNLATVIFESIFLSCIQHRYVFSVFFNPYFECFQKEPWNATEISVVSNGEETLF